MLFSTGAAFRQGAQGRHCSAGWGEQGDIQRNDRDDVEPRVHRFVCRTPAVSTRAFGGTPLTVEEARYEVRRGGGVTLLPVRGWEVARARGDVVPHALHA